MPCSVLLNTRVSCRISENAMNTIPSKATVLRWLPVCVMTA